MRDFAFCASDSYETVSEVQDDVEITVYYSGNLSVTAKRAMEIAKKSLELCNDKFGKYPYNNLSVVMNGLAGGVSGMEYPTLIMISPEMPIEDLGDMGYDVADDRNLSTYMISFDNSICHEIAHQWFYGIVGNNQVTESWLDEGLCRYSEYLYQQVYPPILLEDSGVYLMKDRFTDFYVRMLGKGDGASYAYDTAFLDKSLYYWIEEDPMGYGEIYDKAASLVYQMQEQMGEDEFDLALKEYVQNFAYGIVTTTSFKDYWNPKSDFSELLELYLKVS